MDRIKEIETWLENQKFMKTLANKPVYADDIKSPLDTPLSHIEYLLAENKRLGESLEQIKYEYEQGTDDKVPYRMYMESVQALREDGKDD